MNLEKNVVFAIPLKKFASDFVIAEVLFFQFFGKFFKNSSTAKIITSLATFHNQKKKEKVETTILYPLNIPTVSCALGKQYTCSRARAE